MGLFWFKEGLLPVNANSCLGLLMDLAGKASHDLYGTMIIYDSKIYKNNPARC